MRNLVCYGDPMCSWCYGFGPELAALLEARPDVPLRIVVGGLRNGAVAASPSATTQPAGSAITAANTAMTSTVAAARWASTAAKAGASAIIVARKTCPQTAVIACTPLIRCGSLGGGGEGTAGAL